MTRLSILTLLVLAGCGGGGGGGDGAGPPSQAFVSSPDCPSPANFVVQENPAPLDVTFMRVQDMGDPGTPELAGQVANPVTWAVGELTGYLPADRAATQRGFRNEGPPAMTTAFQLGCEGAGFFVNTFQFSHSVPLVGEGPNVSIARDFSPPRPVYRDASSVFAIEAEVDVHHAAYQAPHTAEGTAQASFFYYIHDSTTGRVFAHVIGLFDSRPPNVANSMVENLAHDFVTPFAFSPLLPVDGAGNSVQFVRVGAGSALARTVTPWRERLRFRAEIPYDRFAALLARLRAGAMPTISPRPEDYRLGEFGVLGEVFPGTGADHNVSFGVSVFNLRATGG